MKKDITKCCGKRYEGYLFYADINNISKRRKQVIWKKQQPRRK
jgi:hypothetical protein